MLCIGFRHWFRDVNVNVILRMIAGKRYSTGSDDDLQQVRRIRRVLPFHGVVCGWGRDFCSWMA